MGIYLNGIIPYDFNDLDCHEKATAEIHSILKKIQERWHFTKGFHISCYDDELEYSIDLPNDFGRIRLRNSFIEIDTSINYTSYFHESMWWRTRMFDIAEALDADTVYLGAENSFHNHNYGKKEWFDNDFTIDDWKKEFHDIPMYDDEDEKILTTFPDWIYLFQETFTACKERKAQLKKKFKNYEIVTISTIGNKFILALNKDKRLVLLDEENNKELECGEIDGIDQRFNGAGFAIYKGTTSAFYTPDGKKITDYKERKFDWCWGNGENLTIMVKDCQTNEVIHTNIL